MTPEQITKALDRYIDVLEKTRVPSVLADKVYLTPERYPASGHNPKREDALRHALWMALEAKKYAAEKPGSGMTDTRVKMLRLFDLAVKGEIGRVVVEHKDRLARFNFNVFQKFFESHGVEVEWIDDVLPKSYEAELVEDMVSLMASFSAKVYGKRSAENRKRKKAEKVAVAQ
jgi:DNA invertase Pin-like site-specific DNA recombinase